jgi:hypothetical protein
MQIIKEKPQIDLVFEPYIQAKRQKIEQKDRPTNTFEIYSCLKELETANFEKQNPETLEMKFFTILNTSTLSENKCEVKKSSLNLPQIAENSFCDSKLELTEIGSQTVTSWTKEPIFCQLVREDWN